MYRILSMDTASSFSQQLFEQLFRQYKRKYLLIANSYVRDSKTAEDIVHDSFMAVWEHRDNINGANIEAYLYKVIRNNCLMYRRNQQIGQAVYEQIKLKERSAMDYYTRAIESCDPDILFRNEILEICRAQLEQMPETDAADIQGPAAGGKELQGDCRTIWHSAEKGRQTTSTGSYQVASRIERLFLDYLYLIERIRLRSEIRVTINSSVLGSENEIILE